MLAHLLTWIPSQAENDKRRRAEYNKKRQLSRAEINFRLYTSTINHKAPDKLARYTFPDHITFVIPDADRCVAFYNLQFSLTFSRIWQPQNPIIRRSFTIKVLK